MREIWQQDAGPIWNDAQLQNTGEYTEWEMDKHLGSPVMGPALRWGQLRFLSLPLSGQNGR